MNRFQHDLWTKTSPKRRWRIHIHNQHHHTWYFMLLTFLLFSSSCRLKYYWLPMRKRVSNELLLDWNLLIDMYIIRHTVVKFILCIPCLRHMVALGINTQENFVGEQQICKTIIIIFQKHASIHTQKDKICMCVCLSEREELGSYPTDFHVRSG